ETHFVRVVREDPARRGLLFAGTEFGVYVSFDDGGSWQTLQLNLPVVPVHDLAIKDHDLAAATHGRAFWVLDDITPLEQLSDEIAHSDRHLFTPRDAVRFRGPGFVPARSLAALGTNPPNGAIVYCYLKQKPEEEATLAVPDARVTVGGWSETRGFNVTMDPRVKATQDDLQKQFDLLVRIRARVSAADDAVQQIRDVKEQIDAAAKRAKALPAGKGAAVARAGDSL